MLSLTRIAVAAAAAINAASASAPSLYSDRTPPVRFQGDATVSLELSDQQGIDRRCHPRFGAPPAGMKTDACEMDGRVVAPNPCTYPDSDAYAHLLCHELGHVNGWPRTHGD